MKFSPVALLGVAGLAAAAQPHAHQHRHPARANKVQRDVVTATEVIAGPVETVYMLNGHAISAADVEAGLESGKYVLVGGDEISSVAQSSLVAEATSAFAAAVTGASKSAIVAQTSAAEFVQVSSSSSAYVAPTTSSAAATTAATSAEASSSSTSASSSSSDGNWADFPSGTIDCDQFPSEYGPVPLDYLGLDGWIGLQYVGTSWDLSSTSAIETIDTIKSGPCSKNQFCSYACPAGYQKSQWPTEQGSTGQSVGGLFCNSKGKLELSRSSVPQLCIAGAGGVTVENKLSKNVCVCRTDYPGLESETVPLSTAAGGTYELTCPDASNYYTWEGLATSAQYYINPAGADPSKACAWGSAGSNYGNWAPLNAGVGKDVGGTTWLSLIPNSPTNTYGKLDFTVTIEGDVSGNCSYSHGIYYNNGVESPTGCTVSIVSKNGNSNPSASYVFTE